MDAVFTAIPFSMKRTFLLLLCLVAFFSSVQAQGITFGAGIGGAMPQSGRFNDFWSPGPAIEANAGYMFSPSIGLQARVGYNIFSLDQDAVLAAAQAGGPDVALFGGDADILTVMANALVFLSEIGPVHPYLMFGLGYYDPNIQGAVVVFTNNNVRTISPIEDQRAGILLGAGTAFSVSNHFAVTVEARYESALAEAGNRLGHIPFTFGVQFR